MTIPLPLPPDLKGFDVSVVRVESLRLDMPLHLDKGGVACKYREILEGRALVVLHAEDQSPVAMRHENMTYLVLGLIKLDLDGFSRMSVSWPTVRPSIFPRVF